MVTKSNNNVNIKAIFKKLLELKNNAYCPYSKFYVAAIVRANDKYYYGVNIENAAFPSGNCAERSAIATAISYGEKQIDELYLLTKSYNFGMPCGSCRQFMSEFMQNDDTRIFVFNPDGDFKEYTISEILLNRFSKKDMI